MSKEPIGDRTIRERLRAVALTFLPPQLRELSERHLLSTAAAVVGGVVAAPLLIAFLAALWLSLAKASGISVLQSFQRVYVTQIHEGFGIDDQFVEKSRVLNTRLDYLQVLDFSLGADGSGEPPIKNVGIEVQPGQRAVLRLNHVSLDIPDDTCRISERDTSGDLLDVAIGRKHFIACEETITRVGGCIKELDERGWQEFRDEFRGSGQEVASVIKFERATAVRSTCARVRVEGTLSIFKDVFPLKP